MARVSTTEGGYGGGASVIHTNSSHSEYVSVPDADLLFRGDYHRAGPDLVLTGHDGSHHIVLGYFASEKHAALVAPNGASLSADVVDLLAGSAAPGQYAQAQPTAPPDSIGKVEKIVGDVTVVRNGVSVALHVGDAVFKSDVIATGSDSSAGITFPDGTVLDLVANSRMALNEYSFEPNGANNGAVFTLVEGTFGFVAGQVAQDNHMSVVTPVATMGIRGTAGIVRHEFRANAGDLLYSFLVLDEIDIRRHGHHVGAYEVRDNRPDSPTFGEILQYIADSGYVTSVEAQGSGLPPIVTTEPITNSRLFSDRPILQDLVDSYSQFNGPGGIHSPGSGDTPNLLFGPQFLPENGGGNPINFVGVTPTGGTNIVATTTSSTTPPPEAPSPPVIAVTTPTQTLVINTGTAISGVSVTETGATSGEIFTVTVSDTHGILSVNTAVTGGGGGGTVNGSTSGSGTSLTIVGTLSQVNADLTTLTDNNKTPGSDPITVTAIDSLGNSATPATINVTVALVAEAPSLTVSPVTTNEGGTAALTIAAAQVESDLAAADLTVNISGLQGGSLNHGTLNSDGSYTLTLTQLTGLTYTPPSETTGTVNLSVTATDTEPSSGTSASSSTQTLAVTINPVAEAPSLTVSPVTTNEGGTAALTIAAAQVESDLAAADLTVNISGLQGGSLNHGTLNSDGSYTLTLTQLTGLTYTPPSETTGTVNLSVTATDTEPSSGTSASSSTQTLAVTINPVAEAPSLTVSPVTTNEGGTAALTIAAAQVESDLAAADLTVNISGLQGGSLNHGTLNSDGSYTLTLTQLTGLTYTPPSETTGTVNLSVTATDTEPSSGTSASSSTQTLAVTINPVAEAPSLTVSPVTTNEGGTAALTIAAAQVESDLAAADLTVNISGLQGGSLNHGTLNSDGSYTLTLTQLTGLTYTPPSETTGTVNLSVTATDTEPSSGTSASSSTQTLAVTINPVAEAPSLTVSPVTTNEGGTAALTIAAAQVESDLAAADLTVNISGLQGGSLNHGTLNSDGSYTLTLTQLTGLTYTPPSETTGTVNLSVTATDTEPSSGTSASSSTQTLAVTINPVAEAPSLTVSPVTTNEGGTAALTIAAAQVESDLAAADLTVNISGLQGGSLNHGTLNSDGSYTLTLTQLTGLTYTPPSETTGTVNLSVTATDTEPSSGTSASSSTQTLAVTVVGLPVITVPGAETTLVNQTTAIAGVNLSESGATSTETFTVELKDGTGGLLSATATGTGDTVTGAGTNDLIIKGTLSQVYSDLGTLTVKDGTAGTNNITVSATDSFGDTATQQTITVTAYRQNETPEPPKLALGGHAVGVNEGGTVQLPSIKVTPVDSDDILTLTIAGLPMGATITDSADHKVFSGSSFTLTSAEFGSTLTLNDGSNTLPFTLTVTANNTFPGEGASSSSQTIAVTMNNGPAGIAGTPINLALANPSAANGGPVSVTIADVPSDWQLNGGTNLGNGTWTVETNDLSALTVLTAATYTGAMVLGVTETWTNANGSIGTATVADNVEAYAPGTPIFALSGNDALTGAGGNNEYAFAQPIGNDTIYNFNAATDKIDLIGFANIASFNDIKGNIADDGHGDTVITIGAGETITLQGVSAASLTAADFVFNQTPVVENAGNMVVSDGAVLPLSGTIDNTGTIALNSTGDQTELQIVGDGVTLQGGGQVTLSGAAVIIGTGSAAVLTNVDNTISGAGQIGSGDGTLTLINETHGTIDANVAGGTFTLETGTTITNNGVLEALNGGTLQILDPVTGSGSAIIEGGTMIFGAQSNMNVAFENGVGTPTYGELVLGDAAGFSGQISGFVGTAPDTAHSDAIDLEGINYNSSSFSETYDAAKGLLTVTDGSHSASLTFDNFDGTLSFASDGNGGTLITDPPATRSSNPSPSVSVGGPGNDNFVFQPGIGADTVANFNPQADTIELDHFANVQNVQQLAALIGTDAHGDAVIELGHSDSITLPGVTQSYLQAHLQSLVHLG